MCICVYESFWSLQIPLSVGDFQGLFCKWALQRSLSTGALQSPFSVGNSQHSSEAPRGFEKSLLYRLPKTPRGIAKPILYRDLPKPFFYRGFAKVLGALQSPISIGVLWNTPVSVGKKTKMCMCVCMCVWSLCFIEAWKPSKAPSM